MMDAKYKMDKEQIVELLKVEIKEEENIRSAIRSTMNIYTTILVAILGGIILIMPPTLKEEINIFLLGLILILAGIMEIMIAIVALLHFYSDYKRQAEAIVQEAKLEDLLGMDDPEAYPLNKYWKGESLLPESFIQTRTQCKTSEDFVKTIVKYTDYRIAKVLYFAFVVIGFLLIVLGILFVFGIICT